MKGIVSENEDPYLKKVVEKLKECRTLLTLGAKCPKPVNKSLFKKSLAIFSF